MPPCDIGFAPLLASPDGRRERVVGNGRPPYQPPTPTTWPPSMKA
jgi:hypothetical protein